MVPVGSADSPSMSTLLSARSHVLLKDKEMLLEDMKRAGLPLTMVTGRAGLSLVVVPTRPSIVMTASRLSQSTVQCGLSVTEIVLSLPPSIVLEAIAAEENEALSTRMGAARPSHWSMHTTSCGTSPVAEISTRSAAACAYLGFATSTRTTVTLVVDTVDVAATRRISMPEDCTQRARPSNVGAPESNVTMLSRVVEPRRPRIVTSACLAPVKSKLG
mmetsp:Transcript_20303/g.32483  ORF Transcript_20303/g.32483 Transcript_20303/m.32483 type:complete len:217 (-) Transcript_20303:2878-3528(-)